jgi:hypothetical protein
VFIPLTKGTILSVSAGSKSIWSFLFYKEVVLIFMPIFILSVYRFDEIVISNMVDQNLVFDISLWVICSFSLYFLLYVFLLRTLFNKDMLVINNGEIDGFFEKIKINSFSVAAITTGSVLLLVAIFFLGYKHAFFEALFTGKNLLHVRLDNVYDSNLPTQIGYAITFSYWIAAIYSAFLLFFSKKMGAMLVFMIGLILSTAGGSKAPLVQYVMLFFLAYAYVAQPKVSMIKLFLYVPIYLSLIISIIYFVVSVQTPDLDINSFLKYLVARFGVGQMAGVYETLSIEFRSNDFGWHMIPFARFFVDYPVFSKELMLFTEGRDFSATGVKNSLFIAEAFGIGGYTLMAFSPVIMAFAYIIKGFLLFNALRYFFGTIVSKLYFTPIFFLSTHLTGDFSSFVFQKGTILLLLVLGLVYIVKLIIDIFMRFFSLLISKTV